MRKDEVGRDANTGAAKVNTNRCGGSGVAVPAVEGKARRDSREKSEEDDVRAWSRPANFGKGRDKG